MEYKSLLLAYGLILLMLGVSFANALKLEKDIVFSSIRATVQLIVMGFLLEMIFQIQHPVWFFFILLAMTGVAAMISGKRGEAIPGARMIAFTGIATGSLLTFSLLYIAGVVRPEAHYVIPIGGMIIGNAMNASSLAMNRLIGEMGHQRKQIETLLSLGASRRQASEGAVRQALRSAMIPTLDTMKTVGLVHIPGIMTGFLIAGGSPLDAVKYQLAVVYMIAGAAGTSCVVVALLAGRNCFSRDLQLLDQFRPAT